MAGLPTAMLGSYSPNAVVIRSPNRPGKYYMGQTEGRAALQELQSRRLSSLRGDLVRCGYDEASLEGSIDAAEDRLARSQTQMDDAERRANDEGAPATPRDGLSGGGDSSASVISIDSRGSTSFTRGHASASSQAYVVQTPGSLLHTGVMRDTDAPGEEEGGYESADSDLAVSVLSDGSESVAGSQMSGVVAGLAGQGLDAASLMQQSRAYFDGSGQNGPDERNESNPHAQQVHQGAHGAPEGGSGTASRARALR